MLPLAPWLVWVLPLVASLFVPVAGHYSNRIRNYYAVLSILLTCIFAASMIPDAYYGSAAGVDIIVPWLPIIGVDAGLILDPLSVLFANLISFLGLIVAIYSLGYMKGEEGLSRYYFFLVLFIGSMIGLVMSDNFLQMFVFWEMVGLCSYGLVSFWSKQKDVVRAGIKVFLITRVGDVCFLAAIALLYSSLGSFSFSYITQHITSIPLSTVTLIAFLMLGGAMVKSAQLPIHTWLYTAMEAPTSISALLHGATMVKAGVYLLARMFFILGPLLSLLPQWLLSISWIGAFSALIGATLALATPDIKGVPAYSTISQIGFMLAAIGSATSATSLGWFAGLFHLMSHAFFQSLGFLAIGAIIHMLGTRDMRQMGGIRKAMPFTFALCIVVLFARTGVPPFASFFSKGLIVKSLASTGDIAIVITIYAAIALTFAYTLRFTILTFLRKESEHVLSVNLHEAPKIMLAACAVLAILCTAWGFVANAFASFMHVSQVIQFSEIFSTPTLIFLVALFIGGFPVYLYYYKMDSISGTFKKAAMPIITAAANGYYIETFYDKVVGGGVGKISNGLNLLEDNLFERIPNLVSTAITRLTSSVHSSFDWIVTKMLYILRDRWLSDEERSSQTVEGSLPSYLVVFLVGVLILTMMLLMTIWM
jgi:NADH-quinone oxidoreductase subunit L